jgi:hypothetical protein
MRAYGTVSIKKATMKAASILNDFKKISRPAKNQ